MTLDEKHHEATLAHARELTGLENPNNPTQLKAWLATRGCHLESLTKAEVENVLETASGVVKEVLELRGDLAKSSMKNIKLCKT